MAATASASVFRLKALVLKASRSRSGGGIAQSLAARRHAAGSAYALGTMSDDPLTYGGAGVNYDALDAFKRACQKEAATTVPLLEAHGAREAEGTRGESAYLIETADGYLAHVEEGLGTKNLVADAMLELTGQSYYRHIGIDTVATIVNDLVTCGALPISIAMHAAVGDSSWFSNERRAADLAQGFADGCIAANAV